MANYAECELLSNKHGWGSGFKAYITYHSKHMKIGKDIRYVVVGKDMITGTKFYKEDYENCMGLNTSVDWAADMGHIKRGKLIMLFHHPLTRPEVLERLRSMSQEDLDEYVRKINEVKAEYEELRKDRRSKDLEDFVYGIKIKKELIAEKGRIRRLKKRG